jgi:enoyl-CoA hydratase/carnithine racemase
MTRRRHAFVTGAGTGIGRAIVLHLAAGDCAVSLAGRRLQHAWGFYNALHERSALLDEARRFARNLADGPWFAHSMTKKMLEQEWSMSIDELIESEAQAQAICMATGDFRRAFEAFAAKRKPDFRGN